MRIFPKSARVALIAAGASVLACDGPWRHSVAPSYCDDPSGRCVFVTIVADGRFTLRGAAGTYTPWQFSAANALDIGTYDITGTAGRPLTVTVQTVSSSSAVGVVPASFQSLDGLVDTLTTSGPCTARYKPAASTPPMAYHLRFVVGPVSRPC